MGNPFKPLEHKFKESMFHLFRIGFRKGQTEFKPLDGNQLKKVLFLRPEKIGDMVISLPVLDGLRSRFPHIIVSILGSPKNYAIIKKDKRFDKVYLYLKKPFKDFFTLREMRKGNYDCVVDMIGNDSVTSLFMTQWAAPGKPRIGIGKHRYREYYDFNYDYRLGNTGHIIDNTLKLLEAFDIDTSKVDGFAPPYVDENELAKANQFYSRECSNSNLKIGYNISAGSDTRIWAEEKSVDLINNILKSYPGSNLILYCMPNERERAYRLKKLVDQPILIVPDKLNLTEVSAFISKLDIMISPDTSIVHIARAFKIPVVGLYSRYLSNFILWRPYKQEKGAVVSNNDHNIFDITSEQVFKAFNEVVEEMGLLKNG